MQLIVTEYMLADYLDGVSHGINLAPIQFITDLFLRKVTILGVKHGATMYGAFENRGMFRKLTKSIDFYKEIG